MFGLNLDLTAPGDDHRAHVIRNLAALGHDRGGTQIFDPGVRAGTNKHAVELEIGDRLAPFKAHVLERVRGGLLLGGIRKVARFGNIGIHRHD